MKFFTIIFSIVIIIVLPLKSFSTSLDNDFYFYTKGDVFLDQIKKILSTNKNFILINNGNKYSADSLIISYQDLNKLDLEHINQIEANDNLNIKTTNNAIITADHYVYSLKALVHTLIAKNNPIVYKDPLRTLIANDRIEYFIEPNVIIIRGTPYIIGKTSNNSSSNYQFKANLINIQLETKSPDKKNSEIEFIEAIDNIVFTEGETSIKANYAIYYKKENQIEFYDNVVFTNKTSSLKGNAAVYNFNLGYGKLLPYSKDSSVTGTYNIIKKKKNE